MWERCTWRKRSRVEPRGELRERHVQQEHALGGMDLGVVALRLDPADAVDGDGNDAVPVAGEERDSGPGSSELRTRSARRDRDLRRSSRARARPPRPAARGRRA